LYSQFWWSQLYLLKKTESITIVERNNISATTAFNHATLEKIEKVEDKCVDVVAEDVEDVVNEELLI
jgi:hypothetical protein